MTVWVKTAECGDYYCDGMHIVAIATTQELAESTPIPDTLTTVFGIEEYEVIGENTPMGTVANGDVVSNRPSSADISDGR